MGRGKLFILFACYTTPHFAPQLIPVLYFVGLSFIPKQYRQEAESRKGGWAGNGQYSESVDHINMSHVRQDRFPG